MDATPTIRLLTAVDSVDQLTGLLHRAYRPLLAAGLKYTAAEQPVDETARRLAAGVGAVATLNGELVGTILVRGGPNLTSNSTWYGRGDVSSAHQFAVEPAHQKRGVGTLLMDWAEQWARSNGYVEIAVHTAEPLRKLIDFYLRRRYRPVETAQWPGQCYRSVILSKRIGVVPNMSSMGSPRKGRDRSIEITSGVKPAVVYPASSPALDGLEKI
jgi:GNAT superfamily N-acetyltransferase